MVNFFKELENLYIKYEESTLIKNKINLIKKIKLLEKKIILNLNTNEKYLIDYILKNYQRKSDFILSRYLYFLNIVNIIDVENFDKIIKLNIEILKNHKTDYEKNDLIYFTIKCMEKFYFKNFENLIIDLSKSSLFFLYKKEFIILMGKTKSSKKGINFLIDQSKKLPEFFYEIHWSIGMIASYKKNPLIKRSLLNNYLRKIIKIIKNNNLKKMEILYFSLSEIFLKQNGIDGKFLNKILEILQQDKRYHQLKDILIKIINNIDLIEEEKEIILKFEEKF